MMSELTSIGQTYALYTESAVNTFTNDNPTADPTRVSISPGAEAWAVHVTGRKKGGGLIKFDYEIKIENGKAEVIGKEELR